jgi:beta-lactam-binding protein with PASTA domain
LESLDLKIGEIHYTPDIAHNAVLESSVNGQSIRAGQRVSKGTVIDFVVGISKDSFPIPDFTRMPLDEVEAYLLGMNLTLQAIHYVEDATKDGKFIKKQLPSPGNIVRSGDKIELWVTRKD